MAQLVNIADHREEPASDFEMGYRCYQEGIPIMIFDRMPYEQKMERRRGWLAAQFAATGSTSTQQ